MSALRNPTSCPANKMKYARCALVQKVVLTISYTGLDSALSLPYLFSGSMSFNVIKVWELFYKHELRDTCVYPGATQRVQQVQRTLYRIWLKFCRVRRAFFYFVGRTKNLVGFSSYYFLFKSLLIWRSNFNVGEWPDFCRCSRRRLSINMSTARTDKMMEFLRLESAGPWLEGGSLGECDTPSKPFEVGLLVTNSALCCPRK